MLTPDGQSGDNMDKIMLLAIWSNTLKKESTEQTKVFIAAGMGKPSFPTNIHTVEMFLEYWRAIEALVIKASESKSELDMAAAAIDYGDGRGDIDPRNIMAEAMSSWYGSPINADNILFTTGGAGALRIIFETFNSMYKEFPKYRVLTPFPHYTLYADNQHQLHSIDVMNEPGYQLTAKALQKSIDEAIKLAEKDKNSPKVLLLSNPSNPLGTVISEEELFKIAAVLRQYPDINIVLDEAYAEMHWNGNKVPSLLDVAPDLKERMVILRSATKGLSAAGERMAMLMAFESELMGKFRSKNISTIGHAPRSAQLAYAHTMAKFDESQHLALKDFYKPKIDFVFQRLREMGAAMPDPSYKIDGAFYVMGDFKDLLGLELPPDSQRALGKTGKVTTSEELAYYLLFKEALMVAPGAYFGLSEKNGLLRITCSGREVELKDMMDRLENCLLQARQAISTKLLEEINHQMPTLLSIDAERHKSLTDKIHHVTNNSGDALALRMQNQELSVIASSIRVRLNQTPEGEKRAARTIHSFFREALQHKREVKSADLLEDEWIQYVNKNFLEGPLKNHFLNLSETDKASYLPWVEHLKLKSQHEGEISPTSKNS